MGMLEDNCYSNYLKCGPFTCILCDNPVNGNVIIFFQFPFKYFDPHWCWFDGLKSILHHLFCKASSVIVMLHIWMWSSNALICLNLHCVATLIIIISLLCIVCMFTVSVHNMHLPSASSSSWLGVQGRTSPGVLLLLIA